MGTSQPRQCGSCTNCSCCSIVSVERTRREQEELNLIEANLSLNVETRKVTFKYPLLWSPDCLSDNRRQAVQIASKLEQRLRKSGNLEDYNQAL